MADEVKPKRPVPPQFLKKKKEVEEAKAANQAEQLPPPPEEIFVPEIREQELEKKEINFQGLVKDLMHNKYFHITEREALPIAENMVKNGFESLYEVKWFLAITERTQLAKELAEKHGLLK